MATTEVLFNPLLPEFHANPYPFYHQLREKDPVHETSMGFWVLTRYDDVVMSLRDPRFGREAFEPLLAAMYGQEGEQGRLPRSMLFRDPPDHTRLRTLVSKAFTPRVIEGMRSHIQSIVDRLLDKVQDAHAMDVIADLAYPLPVTVICEMLGVPTGDHHAIRGGHPTSPAASTPSGCSPIARSWSGAGRRVEPSAITFAPLSGSGASAPRKTC